MNNLKSLAYRGRDEYPETLTSTYDLLVRGSGEFDTSKPSGQNFQRGGVKGGGGGVRGRDGRGFTFTQTGQVCGNGGRSNGTANDDNDNIVQGRDRK